MKHIASCTCKVTKVTGQPVEWIAEGQEYVVSLFLNCNERQLHWPCLVIAQADPDSQAGHGVALHPRVIGELSQTEHDMKIAILHPQQQRQQRAQQSDAAQLHRDGVEGAAASGGPRPAAAASEGGVSELHLAIRKRSVVAATRIVSAFATFWRGDTTAPALVAATAEAASRLPAALLDAAAAASVFASARHKDTGHAALALLESHSVRVRSPAKGRLLTAEGAAHANSAGGDTGVLGDDGEAGGEESDGAGDDSDSDSDAGSTAPEAEAAAALGRILRSAADHARVRGSMSRGAFRRWRLKEIVNSVAMECAVLAGVPMRGSDGVVFEPSGQARQQQQQGGGSREGARSGRVKPPSPRGLNASGSPRPVVPRLPLAQALGPHITALAPIAPLSVVTPHGAGGAPAPSARSVLTASTAVVAVRPRRLLSSPLNHQQQQQQFAARSESAHGRVSHLARPVPLRVPSLGSPLPRAGSFGNVAGMGSAPSPLSSSSPTMGSPVYGPSGALQPPLPPGPPPPHVVPVSPLTVAMSSRGGTGAYDPQAQAQQLAAMAAHMGMSLAHAQAQASGVDASGAAAAAAVSAATAAAYQRQMAALYTAYTSQQQQAQQQQQQAAARAVEAPAALAAAAACHQHNGYEQYSGGGAGALHHATHSQQQQQQHHYASPPQHYQHSAGHTADAQQQQQWFAAAAYAQAYQAQRAQAHM